MTRNTVLPFRAWRYDAAQIKNFSNVIAPPYDVIDDDLRARLAGMSDHNCVRLILPEDNAGDKTGLTRYPNANTLWQAWRKGGALRHETAPGYYFIQQHFTSPTGEKLCREGFIGRFHLGDGGGGDAGIKGHERTLDGPKADRFRLFQATQTNFSPIFSVYSDPSLAADRLLGAEAARRAPDMEATDHLGVVNKMWAITDPAIVSKVREAMAALPLLIADGHHRFETAGNYREWVKSQGQWNEQAGCNAVMMYFANMDSPSVRIFPFHRAIYAMPWLDTAALKAKVGAWFDIASLPADTTWARALDALGLSGPNIPPAYYVKMRSGEWLKLSLKPGVALDSLLAHVPAPLRLLDVVLLHKLVFEKGLGMTEADQAEKRYLHYHADPVKALGYLDEPDHQAVFMLRAPTRDQVVAAVEAGEKMPQKSTYFYPKIVTGLVFNALDEQLDI